MSSAIDMELRAGGCPLHGSNAWDTERENRSTHNSERCIKAAVSVNHPRIKSVGLHVASVLVAML
jgi:hypothetical protein